MGSRHVPAAGFCCFILEETEVNGVRDFRKESGEVEIGRGVLSRVATEDDECFDATIVDGGREVVD